MDFKQLIYLGRPPEKAQPESPLTKLQVGASSKKLDSVQFLRVLAAILVVVCHGSVELSHDGGASIKSMLSIATEKGLFGVDIFFVISGFIMTHVICARRGYAAHPAAFLAERVVRIVPLYWLCTLIFTAIGFIDPTLKHHNSYSIIYIIRSLLFIPSLNPATGLPEPTFGLGWTLNYEMLFYIALSFLLILKIKRIVAAQTIIILGLVLAGLIFKPADVVEMTWTHTILLEFLLGSFISHLYMAGVRIDPILQLALAAVGCIWWLLASPPSVGGFVWRGLVWGLPAALIFFGVVMGRSKASYPALIVLMGDASYSLYLTHLFVMRFISIVLGHLPISQDIRIIIFSITFPVCAAAVSIISYKLIEVPTVGVGRRLLFNSQAMRASQGVP